MIISFVYVVGDFDAVRTCCMNQRKRIRACVSRQGSEAGPEGLCRDFQRAIRRSRGIRERVRECGDSSPHDQASEYRGGVGGRTSPGAHESGYRAHADESQGIHGGRTKSLDLTNALSITLKIIEALEAGYKEGLEPHLAIKPNNMLVSDDLSDVKLADWHVGRAMEMVEEADRKNWEDARYLSPEQVHRIGGS